LSPRLPGQRGAAERRPGRRADGDRQRLLPMAGEPPPWIREGRPEATVPTVRGDGRDRDRPSRPPDHHLGPPESQPDRARGGAGPRLPACPVARPPANRVHLPLNPDCRQRLDYFSGHGNRGLSAGGGGGGGRPRGFPTPFFTSSPPPSRCGGAPSLPHPSPP